MSENEVITGSVLPEVDVPSVEVQKVEIEQVKIDALEAPAVIAPKIEDVPPAPAIVAQDGLKVKAKRKYVKIGDGEFIKIANRLKDRTAIAKETGMSYSGVFFRVKALKKRKVMLSAELFKTNKKKK